MVRGVVVQAQQLEGEEGGSLPKAPIDVEMATLPAEEGASLHKSPVVAEMATLNIEPEAAGDVDALPLTRDYDPAVPEADGETQDNMPRQFSSITEGGACAMLTQIPMSMVPYALWAVALTAVVAIRRRK